MGKASNESYINGDRDAFVLTFIDEIRLFTDSSGISVTSLIAAFDAVEADFSGYTAKDVTQSGEQSTDAQDGFERVAGEVVFTHNGGGTSNSIVGWYAVSNTSQMVDPADPAGTKIRGVLAYEIYDTPVDMSEAGHQIRLKLNQFITGVD